MVDAILSGFILRVQPTGLMTYYYSYHTTDGKRKRYRIGRQGNLTPVQARDFAEVLSAKVINGIDIQNEKKEAKIIADINQANNLGEFISKKFAPWIGTERKFGKHEVARLQANFEKFYNIPMQEISHWLIQDWRTQRLNDGVKPTTINRDIAILKSVISKSVEWGFIEFHPLTKLKPLKVDNNQIVRYLSISEENSLRNALDKRESTIIEKRQNMNKWRIERNYSLLDDLSNKTFADYLKPMVVISMNTGLRRGELFSLSWANIDFDRALLTVTGYTSKSGQTRHIPLNAEALDILKHWRQQTSTEDLVFPNKSGQRFSNVKKAWYNLLTMANIKKFRWHDMRHHFASKLVMKGVDLNTVRELLGHTDIKMTLRYAHLAPEHKAAAVEKLID